MAKRKDETEGGLNAVGPDPGNGAETLIKMTQPYLCRVTLKGSVDLLFHRYDVEEQEQKAGSAKGSRLRKTDNPETAIWRNADRQLCIPGEYLRMAVVNAAKFRQDPRSPRKSAMDLYKAAVIPMTTLAPLGITEWDYLDRRRVVVQRGAVTRVRPAIRAGWQADFDFLCNLPEYIPPDALQSVIFEAGRLIGLGDFRPTYGRFVPMKFEVITE